MTDNQELTSKELDAHKGDDLNNKLLPCPFCGCDNIESIHRPQQYSKWQYTCQCGSCGAESTFEATKDAAITMWNRRIPSKQLTQTQQKLDVAVEALELTDEKLEAAGKAEYIYQRDMAGLKTLHTLDWEKLTDACRARQKNRLKIAIEAALNTIRK